MIQEGEDDVAVLLNRWVLILWLKMKRVFAARTELWRSYLTLAYTINTHHPLIIALVWSVFELFHINCKQLNGGLKMHWMAFTVASSWVIIAQLINSLNLCLSSGFWKWDGTKKNNFAPVSLSSSDMQCRGRKMRKWDGWWSAQAAEWCAIVRIKMLWAYVT